MSVNIEIADSPKIILLLILSKMTDKANALRKRYPFPKKNIPKTVRMLNPANCSDPGKNSISEEIISILDGS